MIRIDVIPSIAMLALVLAGCGKARETAGTAAKETAVTAEEATEAVNDAYLTTFGRDPLPPEVESTAAGLQQGTSYEALLSQLRGSPEWAQQGGMSGEALTHLLLSGFDRPPTGAERRSGLDFLNGGGSLAALAQLFMGRRDWLGDGGTRCPKQLGNRQRFFHRAAKKNKPGKTGGAANKRIKKALKQLCKRLRQGSLSSAALPGIFEQMEAEGYGADSFGEGGAWGDLGFPGFGELPYSD